MDETDYKVLMELQADGRLPLAELAGRVGLSPPAVADRVRKLERQGVIRGYGARVAPGAVGLGLLAFIGVSVDHPHYNEPFLAAVARRPEVLECHHVAGEDSYLLKVICRDTAHLEELLTHGLKANVGVGRTRTTVVLRTVKEATGLPLGVGRP